MKNHGTDLMSKSQAKQLGILIGYIASVITEIVSLYFSSLNESERKALLQNKETLKKKITDAFQRIFTVIDEFAEVKEYWKNIYKNHFSMEVDFTDISVPEKPKEGKWRLIGIAKGLNMNYVADVYKKVISTHNPKWNLWKYADDLDVKVTDNIRTSDKTYFTWVRDEQESDMKFRDKSTRKADPDKKIGETLLERLVHGTVYFIETKQHLDVTGFTLCSGSRDSDGNVPSVCWFPSSEGVDVSWRDLVNSDSDGGVRQAVS